MPVFHGRSKLPNILMQHNSVSQAIFYQVCINNMMKERDYSKIAEVMSLFRLPINVIHILLYTTVALE